MFAEFENFIKNKVAPKKQGSGSGSSSDLSRTPQRYTIRGKQVQEIKLLSEGAFGFIWLAEDVSTKQKYALKRIVCISKERYTLARHQLELMCKFPRSNHVIQCHGGQLVTLRAGNVENKVLVILMEFCPHGTLFDQLEKRQHKGFSEKELVTIARSILEGLRAIHSIGCYHQDVKIENVLIGGDNRYKLCDFGSCSNRMVDWRAVDSSQYDKIKDEMEAVTTPMYRPPQMVDPYLKYQVGFKVDVWMVGCVIYTLAYFVHPFVDSNAIGIANGVYRFPSHPSETEYQVSDKIKDLIRNLLTPNPVHRPSVQQALQLLSNWNNSDTVPLNPEAQRRKVEEMEKEREMERMNRKVVDFDGDIPMEELLKLQQKLKKGNGPEEQPTSFITTKETQKISQTRATKAVAPPTQASFDPFPKAQPQAQPLSQQSNVGMNDFWGGMGSKPAQGGGDKFDSFANFFPSSTAAQPKPQSQPKAGSGDMYDYFFTEEKPKAPATGNSSSNQANLLDL